MLRAKGVAALGVVLGIAGFGVAEAVSEERPLNVQGVSRVEVRSFNGSIRLAAGKCASPMRETGRSSSKNAETCSAWRAKNAAWWVAAAG